MIQSATAGDILTTAHRFLGVPDDGHLSDTYVAAVLRRLAGIMCPCSPKSLLRAMLDAHRGLVADANGLSDQIETVLDDLVAVGDLLELSDVAVIDEKIKGTWVFAAPPAFVIHLGSVAHLIGLSADEQTPLPAIVRDRVVMQGVSRRIYSDKDEDLRALLSTLGLREISSESWLRHPKILSPQEVVARTNTKLSAQGPAGDLEDVRLFNTESEQRSYHAGWEQARNQTGRFIVRRPQAYGADRWGFAELSDGQVIKLIEFPDPGERWRGCDVAWRLLMALKAIRGRSATYRLNMTGDVGAFDFFLPIPDWAKRSLSFAGEQVAPRSCLMSFDIPTAQVAATERFLADFVFLTRALD